MQKKLQDLLSEFLVVQNKLFLETEEIHNNSSNKKKGIISDPSKNSNENNLN
jgi:hypothetical protein